MRRHVRVLHLPSIVQHPGWRDCNQAHLLDRLVRYSLGRIHGNLKAMQAHRVLLETDDQGRLISTPTLPPSARVEAIFLVLEDIPPGASKRQPPAILTNLKILGDVIAPAIDEDDWSDAS